jgi:hypothetical protein
MAVGGRHAGSARTGGGKKILNNYLFPLDFIVVNNYFVVLYYIRVVSARRFSRVFLILKAGLIFRKGFCVEYSE